jgi:hypothetical protein
MTAIVNEFEPSLPDYILVLFSGGIGFRVEPQPGAG